MINFQDYNGSGWGHKTRREIFYAACKYLGQSPTKIESIYGAGLNSLLQSNSVILSGKGLEKVKNDPAVQRLQDRIVKDVKNNPDYKNEPITIKRTRSIQLGGQRAQAEMWRQTLKVWEWADEYKATWQVAFNELTWLLRSINLTYEADANVKGCITIRYSFIDFLDLRPGIGRTKEYNAICIILGFIYHDVIGGNDKMKIRGNWKVTIEN